MTRLRRVITALAVATAALAGTVAPASAVTVSNGASAFASAGYVGSGAMQSRLVLTGSLSGLLRGVIGPIITKAVNPLVNALQGSANSSVGAALGPSSPYAVGTPSAQSSSAAGTFPGELPAALPAPCAVTSTAQPCYSAASVTVPAAPLASVTVTGASGYTQQTVQSVDPTTPVYGRAQDGHTSVSVLAAAPGLTNPVVSTAAVDAKANCPNDSTTAPSASAAASNVSILGGLVTLNVTNGAIASITVNGSTYAGLDTVPVVTVNGATVQPYGDSLLVTLPLTLAQILAALNMPSTVTQTLTQYSLTGNALTLSLIVGPNVDATKSTALGWGLGVAADLSGTLAFDLLGVIRATIIVPTGVSGKALGNLLDVRLAYTSCAVGTAAPSTTWMVPVTLV